jgi:uncharacterized membrane protein
VIQPVEGWMMTTSVFLQLFGAQLAGVVLAVAWWLIRGRRSGLAVGIAGIFACAAGVVGVAGDLFERLTVAPFLVPFDLPQGVLAWFPDHRFSWPLLIGVIAVVLLAVPVRSRRGRRAAALAPRTPMSFARGWWIVAPTVVLGVILLITVVAGRASQPDEMTGRYTMYVVKTGSESSMGTGIYGWFYSIPAMVVIAVLIAVVVIDLVLIARPAPAEDREEDARARMIRTRNVLAAATATLLMHLGLVLGSLAATAATGSWTAIGQGHGNGLYSWTPIAALEPVFRGGDHVVTACGIALWVTVALSAIPARQHARALVPA